MLFASITTGACSLFVSTDGLESGADGGTDAAAEAAVDAASDVAIVDAHEEATTDAAPTPFCVTNAAALFCDDFDVGAIGAKWDSMQNANGTIALDGSQFLSAPFSAHFTADGNSSVVTLERDVAAPAGSYRVAFSLRVTTPPAAGSPYQILLRVSNGNGAQLELYEDNGSFSVNDRINGTYGSYYAPVTGITIGAWVDFVMHVKFAASGGTSSASIDIGGANVVSTFDINAAFNAPSAVGLGIGIPFGSGSSTDVSFDNVVITSE